MKSEQHLNLKDEGEELITLSDFYGKATRYQLQYTDYNDNEWTAPVLLTKERADKFMQDFSVRKLKLITDDNKVFELEVRVGGF